MTVGMSSHFFFSKFLLLLLCNKHTTGLNKKIK